MFITNEAEGFVLFHRPEGLEAEETNDFAEIADRIMRHRPARLASTSSLAASTQGPEAISNNWSTTGNLGTSTATTFGSHAECNNTTTTRPTETGPSSSQNVSSGAASSKTSSVGHSDSASSHTLSASSHTLSASSRTLSASSRTLSASSRTLSDSSRTLSASSRTLSASSRTLSASSRTISNASCSDDQSAVTDGTLSDSPHGIRDSSATTNDNVIEGRRVQASHGAAPSPSSYGFVPRPRSDSETTCHPLDFKHWGKK